MPLDRVRGQAFDALVDHKVGRRGHLYVRGCRAPAPRYRPWRPALVLIVLGSLLAVLPLAHASPPDSSWIDGIYDDADYDDVVALAVSVGSTLDSAPLIVLSPIPIVLGLVHPAGMAGPAAAGLPSFQIRAPPRFR